MSATILKEMRMKSTRGRTSCWLMQYLKSDIPFSRTDDDDTRHDGSGRRLFSELAYYKQREGFVCMKNKRTFRTEQFTVEPTVCINSILTTYLVTKYANIYLKTIILQANLRSLVTTRRGSNLNSAGSRLGVFLQEEAFAFQIVWLFRRRVAAADKTYEV